MGDEEYQVPGYLENAGILISAQRVVKEITAEVEDIVSGASNDLEAAVRLCETGPPEVSIA